MNFTPPLTIAERLASSLDGLCRAVAARIAPGMAGWVMQAPMIMLVWTRIRRSERKIQALLAQFQAGLLRVRPTGERSGGKAAATAKLPRGPTANLPRRFAWLCGMVPYEAAGFASQLRGVLAEPEMVALLEASAQARRVLAPVCRMLGIEAEMLRAPAPSVLKEVPVLAEVSQVASDRDEDNRSAAPAPPDPVKRVSPYRIRWGGD